MAFSYADMRYKDGTCPVAADGTHLPCPDAWGAVLGTMLCTVLIQMAMSLVPPKYLNKIFPKVVTGSLLLLVGVYLIGNGMQNWAGSSNCNGGEGYYALCPSIDAPKPLPWADPKLIGLGFSVFISIVIVEQFGAPLMKSASVLIGLAVGCIISGATGYWSKANIDSAPAVTFLWVHTFRLSVDGALVLPLLIMVICEGVSCMPDILATAEISGVEVEGTQSNSRIQGGILCDGLGSLISALGTGLPMVSQAGNNGVIVLTGCAVSNSVTALTSCTDFPYSLVAPAGPPQASSSSWASSPNSALSSRPCLLPSSAACRSSFTAPSPLPVSVSSA